MWKLKTTQAASTKLDPQCCLSGLFFFFIEAYVDEFCINLMQVRVIEEEGTSTEAMPLYNLPAFLDFDRLVILAITFLRGSHDATGAKILHQYPA